jgi:hypothetical protein
MLRIFRSLTPVIVFEIENNWLLGTGSPNRHPDRVEIGTR